MALTNFQRFMITTPASNHPLMSHHVCRDASALAGARLAWPPRFLLIPRKVRHIQTSLFQRPSDADKMSCREIINIQCGQVRVECRDIGAHSLIILLHLPAWYRVELAIGYFNNALYLHIACPTHLLCCDNDLTAHRPEIRCAILPQPTAET